MKIKTTNLTRSKINESFLKNISQKAINLVKLKGLDCLSIVIVGDKKIRELNKKHKNRDRITDVLAFNYASNFLNDFFDKEGEIVICLPQAKRQAKEIGHSLKKELVTLIIHGILHLKGFNDEKPKEYKRMLAEQNRLFEKIKEEI